MYLLQLLETRIEAPLSEPVGYLSQAHRLYKLILDWFSSNVVLSVPSSTTFRLRSNTDIRQIL